MRVEAEGEIEVDQRELQALIEEARRRARRRRLRTAAAVLALGAGLTALYFVVIRGDNGGGPDGSSPRPAAGASGVQFIETKSKSLGIAGSYSQRDPVVTRAWVEADGSGVLRTTRLAAEWPGPRDRARAIASGDREALKRMHAPPRTTTQKFDTPAAFDEALGGGSFPPTESLSADPSELRDQIHGFVEANGNATPRRIFEVTAAVLGKPNTPEDVRAAAFTVLPRLPGVVVDRSARDPRGRRSISAALTSSGTGASTTQTVYFDPRDALELAFTEELTQPAKFIDSKLLGETVLLKSRQVSSVP